MSRDKRLIIICLLILIVSLTGIPEANAMAPGTRVRLEPADPVVGLDQTFVVQVVIEEAKDLGGFQFDLVYDPSILQVETAALSAFLGSTGNSAIAVGPEVNNVEGRVTFGAIGFGSAVGPSGTGVLATITWQAQGEGSTALRLLEVQVLDTAANAQRVTAEDGQVVVRGAKAPTPVATDTPAPAATYTTAPARPATPEPTSTPQTADTPPLVATTLPSPTPPVTRLTTETPTKTPPVSPRPGATIAPTETEPMEVTTPLTVAAAEPTYPLPTSPSEGEEAPTAVATVPTLPPTTPTLPSPSAIPLSPPTPMPSPTPLVTISLPSATGPSGGAVLGLMLAALAVAILVVFILSHRPGV